MRINSPIEKSGYFWLPTNPDKKLPGKLSILSGGKIELEIVGLFDESIAGLNKLLNNADELNRIIGHIEEYGYVTLDGCYYKNRNYAFGGISRSIIRSSQAIMSVAFDQDEPIMLNNFKFSVEGINEWVGISGISVTNDFELRTTNINYTPPKELIFKLNNGIQLTITYSWNVPFVSNPSEAKLTQKTYFKLTSEVERQQSDFVSTAYKLTTLLCFAVDKTICINEVFASANSIQQEIGDKKKPLIFEIFYQSLPWVKEIPKIEMHKMLFRFPQIRDEAENIINKWLLAYESIDPALNLYFSSKAGDHKYLDSNFLALAQGLETYHRRTSDEKLMKESLFHELVKTILEKCPEKDREWLNARLIHGNEISLSKRIKRIIEPFKEYFGSSKEREKMIRSIVNTRNYLTHYSESLKEKAADGVELWAICQKMEAMFQLHILNILGFSKNEVSAIYKNSENLRNKIKPI